jgi:hypothetical protein
MIAFALPKAVAKMALYGIPHDSGEESSMDAIPGRLAIVNGAFEGPEPTVCGRVYAVRTDDQGQLTHREYACSARDRKPFRAHPSYSYDADPLSFRYDW